MHTQSKAMELPCSQIIRAVDPNSTTLFLLFSLVFTKPEVFPSDVIPSHTARVGIDGVSISISPSATGSDPLARCKRGKQETSNDGFEGMHSDDRRKLSTNQPRLTSTHHSSYTISQAVDRMVLPRRPTRPRWRGWLIAAPLGGGAGTAIFP